MAACGVVGVPASTRVAEVNVKPAGAAGVRLYVNAPLPPKAFGSVTGEIATCS